jgi:nitrogen fixation protein NifU and related proteins
MDAPEPRLDELYREVVLDHHRHPRGRSPLAHVDATAHGFNPVCGDDVVLAVALKDDTLEGVQVTGRGCAICTASGSMLAELLPGKSAAEAELLARAFRGMMQGAEVPAGLDMGELEALQGVRTFALRVKCAMLPWVTLEEALRCRAPGCTACTTTTEGEVTP